MMHGLVVAIVICACAWAQRASADDDPDDADDAKQAPLDAADKLERVPTRKGITVPVVIREGAKPTAVVLLYAAARRVRPRALDRRSPAYRGRRAIDAIVAIVADRQLVARSTDLARRLLEHDA